MSLKLDLLVPLKMCGEHRESGILNEGYLAPAEVSGSSKLSLEMPGEGIFALNFLNTSLSIM